MKKRKALIAGLSMLTLGATAFAAKPAQAQSVKLNYWLWDSNQLPMYQQCAANFTKANPGITVDVQQKGWDDYWTGITAGFVSGTAPDVFTDHLAKYPEFANNDQIVDLAPLIAKDKVDTKQYLSGLYDVWGKNGKQYGLPEGLGHDRVFYNKNMVTKAGVTDAELANMTWDPKTGGTFEKVLKKLTVRRQGQERRPGRLQQEEDQGLRPRHTVGRRVRPDRVEPLRRIERLQVQQWTLGHVVQLCRPEARRDPAVARRPRQQEGPRARVQRHQGHRPRHAVQGPEGRHDHRRFVEHRYVHQARLPGWLRHAPEGTAGTQVDVQRSGRLDLEGLQAPGRSLAVPQVPGFARRVKWTWSARPASCSRP